MTILNPHLISLGNLDSSSVRSLNGFAGKSHAVIMLVFDEISGPLYLDGFGAAQAARPRSAISPNLRPNWVIIASKYATENRESRVAPQPVAAARVLR